jgi:predicted double-glycine peptidase
MMLDGGAPPTHVVETFTGAPFGCQLLAGELPLFDPYGWSPELGLDQALVLLGFQARRTTHRDGDSALEALRQESALGPVLVGPVDGAAGTPTWQRPVQRRDHFVVVTAADRSEVTFHDPRGHPYVVLPTPAFLSAWRAEAIGYLQDEAYVMRTAIRRTHDVAVQDALCALVPIAARY